MATPLNLPKTEDQFEVCPYVNDMNQHQLKVLHKRVVLNLQELANAIQERCPDVAMALDNILDGHAWKLKELAPVENTALFGDCRLTFNLKNKTFVITEAKTNKVFQTLQATAPKAKPAQK